MVVVPLPQRGEEAGDVGLGHLAHALDAGRGQVLGVAPQVAAVGGDGVGGQAALDGQVVEVAGDDPLGVRPGADSGSERQRRTSWSPTAAIPWASATSGSTTCPSTTLTPVASAGLPATAAAVPSLASAIT